MPPKYLKMIKKIDLDWGPNYKAVDSYFKLLSYRNQIMCFLDDENKPEKVMSNCPKGMKPPRQLSNPFFLFKDAKQPAHLLGRIELYVKAL